MRGLALEGGGMRGMFTCGVLDVFLQEGIAFDKTAGISAGAALGCNLKSEQQGRALRYNVRYARDWRYCSLRSLLLTGDLFGADFCYRVLPEELDPFDRETFGKNPMEFYVGATQTQTGRCCYHLCTDGGAEDMLWIRASASMPIVSRPVEIEGRTYLDGGIDDAVPFAFLEGLGCEKMVIVLTQPGGYRKKAGPDLLWKLCLSGMPAVLEKMCTRPERYNRQMEEIEKQEAEGRVFVIRPPEALALSRTEKDPKKLKAAYTVGLETAAAVLPRLLEYMETGG